MEFNFEQASYQELLSESQRVSLELETLKNKMMYVEKAFANRDRQFTEGQTLIKDMIEEGEITNVDYISQLVETFKIEILKEVNFTISVEVTGTVQIPMGTELDEYSFSIDGMTYNGEDVSVDSESVTIDGWEFSE